MTKTFQYYTEAELENMFPEVKVGGFWEPLDCRPSQNIAVIIPFRYGWGSWKPLGYRPSQNIGGS